MRESIVFRRDVIYQEIIKFWFKDTVPIKWYRKDYLFDREVFTRFLGIYEAAFDGELVEWRDDSESALAEIILIDQFSKNLFRKSVRRFEGIDIALNLAKEAIAKRYDRRIQTHKLQFLFAPFMHSEDIKDHNYGLRYFRKYKLDTKYILEYKKILEKFGRFPQRNELLGRESTSEELAFLKTAPSYLK